MPDPSANNGGSKALRPPHSSNVRIELVHFERQLQLADDGCFVETGGTQSAIMRYNWCVPLLLSPVWLSLREGGSTQ